MSKKTLFVGAALALGLSAGSAAAADRWSIQVGFGAYPVSGVVVYGNPPPVVYVPPPPVRVTPRVVYRAPVFVAAPVVTYYPPYYYRGRWDRWERWDHHPGVKKGRHR